MIPLVLTIIFAGITLLIAYPRGLSVARAILGEDTPSKVQHYFAFLMAHTQLIEFVPMMLAAYLIVRAFKWQTENIHFFAANRGYPWLMKIKQRMLIYSTIICAAFCAYSGFIVPILFKQISHQIKQNIFEDFLAQPQRYLKENQSARLGNLHILNGKIKVSETKWQTSDIHIWQENANGRMDRLDSCKQFQFDSHWKTLTGINCYTLFLQDGELRVFKKVALDKKRLRDFYNATLTDDQVFKNLPYQIKKYTYSSAYILHAVLNLPCPGGGLELLDRLLYFAAFFLYAWLGFLITYRLKFKDYKSKVMLFGFLVIILPGISLLLRLDPSEATQYLGLTYFWPIGASIALFGFLVAKDILRKIHLRTATNKE